MTCDVFRWNLDPAMLDQYDGYIIGGGFSYQDRVRAGVIATKEPVVDRLFTQVVEESKPLLGICNGAQVLVEAGLVPGLKLGEVEMALAPNRPHPAGRIGGFCCRWVYVKHVSPPGRCVFTTKIPQGEVIPIPIAHGEGRYTTRIPEVLEKIRENGQTVFQYCDVNGNVLDDPDINPNGAVDNLAAVCNPEGNVLAIMPHPERASFLRQIPSDIAGVWGRRRVEATGKWDSLEAPGPGLAVFVSMRDHILSCSAAVAGQ
jgi:phosphoribosylformylglycinamidine synthase